MRKYVFYCGVESMPQHKITLYTRQVKDELEKTGFIRPVDKLLIIPIQGESRLEVFKPSFIECIISYIDVYFGKLDKVS